MNEVLPGVLHWTTHHEGIGTRVHSHFAVESAALIDPRVPDGGIEEIAQYGRPERILLSNRHHLRHSERFADEFGCPIRCHEAGVHEFDDGPDVRSFRFGEEVAPGITALEMGALTPEDTVFRLQAGPGRAAVRGRPDPRPRRSARVRPRHADGRRPGGREARAAASRCGGCSTRTSTRCCSPTASRWRRAGTPRCGSSWGRGRFVRSARRLGDAALGGVRGARGVPLRRGRRFAVPADGASRERVDRGGGGAMGASVMRLPPTCRAQLASRGRGGARHGQKCREARTLRRPTAPAARSPRAARMSAWTSPGRLPSPRCPPAPRIAAGGRAGRHPPADRRGRRRSHAEARRSDAPIHARPGGRRGEGQRAGPPRQGARPS